MKSAQHSNETQLEEISRLIRRKMCTVREIELEEITRGVPRSVVEEAFRDALMWHVVSYFQRDTEEEQNAFVESFIRDMAKRLGHEEILVRPRGRS